jgi:hypothetical protein
MLFSLVEMERGAMRTAEILGRRMLQPGDAFLKFAAIASLGGVSFFPLQTAWSNGHRRRDGFCIFFKARGATAP